LGLTNTAQLTVTNLDLSQADIAWEARNQEPLISRTYAVKSLFLGPDWVEAEALFPDGRRVFAANTFNTQDAHPVTALASSAVEIAGSEGENFILQRSLDLQQWTPILTNTFSADTFDYVDPDAGELPVRFYRAVATP
jgi:hypothetical protein